MDRKIRNDATIPIIIFVDSGNCILGILDDTVYSLTRMINTTVYLITHQCAFQAAQLLPHVTFIHLCFKYKISDDFWHWFCSTITHTEITVVLIQNSIHLTLCSYETHRSEIDLCSICACQPIFNSDHVDK